MSNDELARFLANEEKERQHESEVARHFANEMIERAERTLAKRQWSPIARALAIGEYLAEAWHVGIPPFNSAYDGIEDTYRKVRELRRRARKELEREQKQLERDRRRG